MRDLATILLCISSACYSQIREGSVEEKLGNGQSVITVYGNRFSVLPYNSADTSHLWNITGKIDMLDGSRHGRYIQFYKYPSDTAQIIHYKFGLLHGEVRTNHRTGAPWSKAYYKNGVQVGETRYYDHEGRYLDESIQYDSITQNYFLNDTLVDSTYSIFGHAGALGGKLKARVYFDQGQIDSIQSYSYVWWGLHGTVHRNYRDSIRTYIIYQQNGDTLSMFSSRILEIYPEPFYRTGEDFGELFIANNDKTEPHGVCFSYHPGTKHRKYQGQYVYGEKTGVWKYYDLTGSIVRTEKH